MQLPNTLEKKFSNLAIPNLINILIIGQVVGFLLVSVNPQLPSFFALRGNAIFGPEWWRVVTFLFLPLSNSPIWVAFTWYLYYILGSALERIWGADRFTLYFGISYLLTILCAVLFPAVPFTNAHMFMSLFLAFAYIHPEFTLTLFFVLPVQIKWLAYLAWAGILLQIINAPLPTKVITLFSVGNFLLFFGGDIFRSLLSQKKQIKISPKQSGHFMQCFQCHKTEADRKIFSYCKTCSPETQYCEDHINTHTHKK